MSLIWKMTGLVLVLAAMTPSFAGEDEDASAAAMIVSFRSSTAKDSAAIDKAVIEPLRKAAAPAGNVLFIDVDLSTKESANQGRLLLTALGLRSLYEKQCKKPGTAVLWGVDSEEVALEITAKTKADEAVAALKKLLNPPEEDDGGGDDGDDDGGDDEDGE